MTTSRPRSRRGSGEELREALIVATSELLDTHELDDLSVRTVTAATGVSPTALYLHFSDVDALVHEVKKRFFATLGDRLRAAEGLQAIAHAYLAYAREHPGHYAVLFQRHLALPVDDQEAKPGMEVFGSLVEVVGRCGAPAEEAFDYGVVLWTALHGRASVASAMPDFPFPDEDRYVELLASRVLG